MGLFRSKKATAEVEAPAPTPEEQPVRGTVPKGRPTPTRKQAEAERRARLTPTMNKKEARKRSSQQARAERLKNMSARDNTPEKILLRDYVDSRFNVGEFLLPSLVVILALTFLNSIWPAVTLISTVVMYGFIALVILDGFLMWRGFKKVLQQRLPGTPTRGLLMYGMNRSIQIRRFRMPSARVKRGEEF